MIWLSFTSGSPSLQQAVFCLSFDIFFVLIYPGVLLYSRHSCAKRVRQLIFTVCILLLSTLSAGAHTLLKLAACCCRVLLNLLRLCVNVSANMSSGLTISIMDLCVSHFTPMQKFN